MEAKSKKEKKSKKRDVVSSTSGEVDLEDLLARLKLNERPIESQIESLPEQHQKVSLEKVLSLIRL
jgi:hypothetical protein